MTTSGSIFAQLGLAPQTMTTAGSSRFLAYLNG
jgi:hypothetical protein